MQPQLAIYVAIGEGVRDFAALHLVVDVFRLRRLPVHQLKSGHELIGITFDVLPVQEVEIAILDAAQVGQAGVKVYCRAAISALN